MRHFLFQVEPYSDVKGELATLWPDYWEEIRDDQEAARLSPNDEIYQHYEQEDKLIIVTVREAINNTIIGFSVAILSTHLNHSDVLCAFGNAWYVKPAYRKGLTGYRLLCEMEKRVMQHGAERMYIEITPRLDVEPLLRHRGWSEATRQYCKEFI